MARRRRKNNSDGSGVFIIFTFGLIAYVIKAAADFVVENAEYGTVLIMIVVAAIAVYIVKKGIDNKRKELLTSILDELQLEDISLLSKEFDDQIIVKSARSLDTYSRYVYLRDPDAIARIRATIEDKCMIVDTINSFLVENSYKTNRHYEYVERQLINYSQMPTNYKVKIVYITSAGNNRGEKYLEIEQPHITEVIEHPELLLTKAEYNKLLRQQAREELDAKKSSYYDRLNAVIDFANDSKEVMVVKPLIETLDRIIPELIEKTQKSIKKAKTVESDEWSLLESNITKKENEIRNWIQIDKQISDYYDSKAFALVKDTCSLMIESQKEFNEYIEEKAESITKLFGKRSVRSETQTKYVYNYIRAYKKSISPFTAEVTAYVYGNAERNPMEYVVKYFYPNKSRYKEQIQNLRILIEELETLQEAKIILDDYKRDYNEHIQNVPEYVMEHDEEGFYSRLGLTIIDETVLNFEYRFAYTSDGGMVQKNLPVLMNEETIADLINLLESKLTIEAFTKEQRALMNSKLRAHIKERDHYTCCLCKNSVYAEPNLLLEIDHIIPVSKGGLTREDNLQTLCWRCNRMKGAKIGI